MSCNNTLNDALSAELVLNVNDIHTIHQLLYNGANINYQSKDGWCLLFELISLNKYKDLRSLYEYGIDMKLRDTKNRSALFWTIHHGHTDILDVLTTLKYPIDELITDNLPSLHYAVYKSNPKIINILLDAGLNIESVDAHHNTALDYAYIYDKKNMITLLEQRGASTANLEHL
ncbi:MAG: Unknown protein [uncultured Sulfurovum sp.]|uniref:Uncharacterized protein n=1 Tax=uncultured Sulfurovum sp. TaxID=269237 RepID=A0A6S6UI35_9BACT|nr:MAG: Unknown protein [uncultured Sulfurovum sp.]